MTRGKMITETTVKAKVVIPLKSRIAAWWMLIVGGIAGALGLALLLGAFTGVMKAQDELGLIILIFGAIGMVIFVVYFIPGLLVLKGGRWGWIIASAILSIAAACSVLYSLIPLIAFLIPLTLILLDHISYRLVALFLILMVIIYFVIPNILKIWI